MELLQVPNMDRRRVAQLGARGSVSEYRQRRNDVSTTGSQPIPAAMNARTYTPHREDIASAMPVFAQYYDRNTGTLKHGGTAAIIRRLFGKDANTGGAYRNAALAVIDQLIDIHATTTTAHTVEYGQNYGD